MVGTVESVLVREVSLIQSVLSRELPLYKNDWKGSELRQTMCIHTYIHTYSTNTLHLVVSCFKCARSVHQQGIYNSREEFHRHRNANRLA